jgi:hypothetical protein
MEPSQNTLLLHDDREAQVLLQRIREKKIQQQAVREKSLELNQLELNQKDKQSLN